MWVAVSQCVCTSGIKEIRESTCGESHGSLSKSWCQVPEVLSKFQINILQVQIFHRGSGMGTYCLDVYTFSWYGEFFRNYLYGCIDVKIW
jgi:hypothetical protein